MYLEKVSGGNMDKLVEIVNLLIDEVNYLNNCIKTLTITVTNLENASKKITKTTTKKKGTAKTTYVH